MNAAWRSIRAAAVTVAGCALTISLARGQTPPRADALLARFESDAGITLAGPTDYRVTFWTDQSTLGGTQDLSWGSAGSGCPAFVTNATPLGKAVARFNGAAVNANILRSGATVSPNWYVPDTNYNVATGESMSWIIAMKPTLVGKNTYPMFFETDVVSNGVSFYGWYMDFDATSGKFGFTVRNAQNVSKTSTITTNSIGVTLSEDWMIATAVYDGSAQTLQLFIKVKTGAVYSGTLASSAILRNDTHKQTGLGGRADRASGTGACADIAAFMVYKTALSAADRKKVEDYLYYKYIQNALPSGTVILLR